MEENYEKIVALLLVVLLALSLCACTAATTQDTTDAYAGLAPTEAAEQAAAATKDSMSLSDIIRVPFGYLLEWLYQFTSNYGLALILFSLVVKVVLLPLSIKSKKSMLKMSRLAPLASRSKPNMATTSRSISRSGWPSISRRASRPRAAASGRSSRCSSCSRSITSSASR